MVPDRASYGYLPFNKLVTTSTAAYVYDNNGNMLRRTDTAGTWQYYWNAENQLVRVVKPGAGPLAYRTINYKYDALGRRVERHMKRGGSVAFTYDGHDVILDQKSDGSTTTYVNGPGIDNKLKQTSSNTGTHYYLQDHLGSMTALTNSSGSISTSITYDAYGNSNSNALTRYGCTGRELDPDTGLMYYRARWYDPQLGRFISEDPIGFAGGDVNLFGYVRNNPFRFKDPSGLRRCNPYLGAFLGGLGGAVAGGAVGAGIGAAIGGIGGALVGTAGGPPGSVIIGGGGLAAGAVIGGFFGSAIGAGLGIGIGYDYCSADDTPSCDVPRAAPMPVPKSTPFLPPPPPDPGAEGTCSRLLELCLTNPWQPGWGQGKYGPRKDCGACYRQCKLDGGAWPFDKCPIFHN